VAEAGPGAEVFRARGPRQEPVECLPGQRLPAVASAFAEVGGEPGEGVQPGRLHGRGYAASESLPALTLDAAEDFLAARRAAGRTEYVHMQAFGPLLGYLRGIGAVPHPHSRRPRKTPQPPPQDLRRPTTIRVRLAIRKMRSDVTARILAA
jgi:hypothetical protein